MLFRSPLFLGNIAQFSSMQMQLVVRGWLVYDITGSFAALGTMALANAVPSLVVSPIGGVVADRATKKTVIQLGQWYNAGNAAVLAVLAAGLFGLQLQLGLEAGFVAVQRFLDLGERAIIPAVQIDHGLIGLLDEIALRVRQLVHNGHHRVLSDFQFLTP